MKLIKYIPFKIRQSIRFLFGGRSHHNDLTEFLASIGCLHMVDVGAERGYESILAAKAGFKKVVAFESNEFTFYQLGQNLIDEKAHTVWAYHAELNDFSEITRVLAPISQYRTYVKVDIDGSDAELAASWFEAFDWKPLAWSVEYEEGKRVDNILRSQGYEVIYALYYPKKKGKRSRFSMYSIFPGFTDGTWGDIIALPKDEMDQFKTFLTNR